MIIQNEIYKKIAEEGFKIIEDNTVRLDQVKEENICNVKEKYKIEFDNIEYFVSANPKGFVIFASNKIEKTIAPIVYGNQKQRIIYSDEVVVNYRDNTSTHKKIEHKGNKIMFQIDFEFFIQMSKV